MTPATTTQRQIIEAMMRRDGRFDMRTVTAMHRLLGAPDCLQGQPTSVWLGTLDRAAASGVIAKLQELRS